MSEKNIPFVVTDRRKFNADGEPREGVDLTPQPEQTQISEPVADPIPKLIEMPAPASTPPPAAAAEDDLPPAPTPEQMEQSRLAFEATADRLDTAIRAANPGADHPPTLTFESLVQSVYMQAVLQLGGGAQQGEQPQIDFLGARQSVDMLSILAEKTRGNLTKPEDLLLSSALFELRLAFLEMTQAIARSAQQRNPAVAGSPLAPGGKPGPNLVR